MANDENLIPFDKRTESEQREITKKGGKASGVARRKKKAMKERMQEALSCEIVNPKIQSLVRQMNLSGNTNYDALVASIIVGAIRGNPVHAKMVLELIGETGQEQRANKRDKREAKLLKMQQQLMELKLSGAMPNTEEDDGFIEALSRSAADDWKEDEDEDI